MLSPKKPRYRKQMKRLRHITGVETRGCELTFGDYGLRAEAAGWLTARQIEAGRVACNRTMKRGGKMRIMVFPDKPITKKPAETRMGSGKGSTEYWVAEVRPGRIMFELTGVPRDVALQALKLASSKMPIPCSVVERRETLL